MIVTQAQLAEAMHYGPGQTAKIEKCLRDQGIQFFYGKGGCIWTTTELIAQAHNKAVASNDHITIDGPHHGQAA